MSVDADSPPVVLDGDGMSGDGASRDAVSPGDGGSDDAGSSDAGEVRTVLVPFGADWRYLDDGSDQGTAWREPGFDDSSWPSGPAPLGYGEGDEATVVDYGPDPGDKHPTTYFRHTFTVDEPARYESMRVRLAVDDGAIVVLNGAPVVTFGVSSDASHDTWASSWLTQCYESTVYTFDIDPALLQSGENVLAVETHQAGTESTDLRHDLELTAYTGPTPPDDTEAVIGRDSEWRYLDDGSDQGTAWREPGFDDSDWAVGPAPLGYGDGDEATVVRYGGDPDDKHVTTYFRHELDGSGLSEFGELEMRLRKDDGAAVYLNGSEIWRAHLPEGPIGFDTLASDTIANLNEDLFCTRRIDPSTVRDGPNVLAVEVHQVARSSSDLKLELALVGKP